MRLSVIGAGYVGLITGTCLAKLGHEVVLIDVDEEKLEEMMEETKAQVYKKGYGK